MIDNPVNSGNELRQFGTKLRTLRLSHNMTLKQLALALGLSAHGYISELESGKKSPTAHLIVSVARLFDVSTDALMRDECQISTASEAEKSH